MRMKFEAAGKTDVGRSRQHNEDFFICDEERGLYIVCDGMGGHAAGEVASRMAAEAVHEMLVGRRAELDGFAKDRASTEIERVLREAIEAASSKVFQHAGSSSGKHGMGTTCVTMLVQGGRAYFGHVGDSRAYMRRGDSVWQLTDDHTYLNEAVKAGWMTQEEAERSPHAHMVTRGVGIQASVKVDTLTVDVCEGDTFLICSDGLHSYTPTHGELSQFMRPKTTQAGVDALINLANERGGSDNISAVLVRASPDSAAAGKRSVTVEGDLRALRHIAMFSDLEMRELLRLGGVFKAEEHPAGTTFIHEGGRDDSMFIVVEGAVEVKKAGERVTVLKEGAHFGEMALLSRHPRTATVVALEPVRTLRLERARFMELVRTEPSIAVKCLWQVAQTLSERLDDAKLAQTQERARSETSTSRSNTQLLGILSPFRTSR